MPQTTSAGRRQILRGGAPWLLAAVVAGAVLTLIWNWGPTSGSGESRVPPPRTLEAIPFDGNAAFQMLTRLCDLGPRTSGSPGMLQQQQLLASHFQELGGTVSLQKFERRHPQDGSRVELANLIVQWHPEREERILLCAHYDTRPMADQDPDPARRTLPMPGANDGASGVAVLAELGRHMPGLPGKVGVDFVLFDGEEFVVDDRRDPYFLGSEHFAREYVQRRPAYRYRAAVLLDMVGDKDLRIYQEGHSISWRDSRPLVNEIWRVARQLGVREFVPRVGHTVRDDHLALHNIARIPACDIIDFDYPRPGVGSLWHTTRDTPENCSPLSLAKVGWVLWEWLNHVSHR